MGSRLAITRWLRRTAVVMTALLVPLSSVAAAPASAADAAPHSIDFRGQATGAAPAGWSSVWRDSEYRVQRAA